jgi:hypothetical protein
MEAAMIYADRRMNRPTGRQRSREGQRDEITQLTGAFTDYTNATNTPTKIQNETYLGLLSKLTLILLM